MKYGNVKTEIDGIVFASKKEAKRYQELKLMEKAKEIFNLELQPSFLITINGVKVCTYRADFAYTNEQYSKRSYAPDRTIETIPERIIEDVKGMKTPVYNLKKKLMKAVHGIEITEI